jgi:superfamily II DNA helicase RecQ
MKFTTRRARILEVANSWRRQYGNRPDEESHLKGKTRGTIQAALDALDLATCRPEAVDNIIGNTSWTAHTCDECERNQETLVWFGRSDYDRECSVCLSCLSAATGALKAVASALGGAA